MGVGFAASQGRHQVACQTRVSGVQGEAWAAGEMGLVSAQRWHLRPGAWGGLDGEPQLSVRHWAVTGLRRAGSQESVSFLELQ